MKEAKFLKKLPLSHPAVHCIGIGGIGVSALAELLLEGNFAVSGSDSELNSICEELQKKGAVIAPAGHRVENLPATGCGGAVMTAAVNINNVEVRELLRRGVMVWSRGEFLAELARCYQRPVMVAGSHGKSSTAAMLGWIFTEMHLDPGLVIGAKYSNDSSNARLGNGDLLVAESDESDGTHSLSHGELALITNIDGDHAWTAAARSEQEQEFQRFARQFTQTLYIAEENTDRLLQDIPNCHGLRGGELVELEAMAPDFMLGYERRNAALALAAVKYLKLDIKAAAGALQSYPGIRRRQSEICRGTAPTVILLEDYAHHPREVASSLEVIRTRYAASSITLVFQPHRYKRLQHYFDDFVKILSDKTVAVKVLPVFSAWDNPVIDAPDSAQLAQAINTAGGNAEFYAGITEDTAKKIYETTLAGNENAVIALIGAGDIEKLTPYLKKLILRQ